MIVQATQLEYIATSDTRAVSSRLFDRLPLI